MAWPILRKITLLAAGAALAASLAAPALAGGGHGRGGHHGYYSHGHGYYGHGWRPARHHGYWRGYGGHRHYRYHRGGLSGAEAGLIAAGIVGAAILIDSANDRSRDRYDRDRYYTDGYYGDRYDDRYDRRGADSDFYYRRDDRRLSDREWEDYSDDALDEKLAGKAGGGRGEYNYGAAYNDCKAETRAAARDEGLTVGLPARPDRIDRIEGGAAVRFVTAFEVQDRGRGDRQTMVCEADADGVRFLELV
jgi:hypothetical protein